MKDGKRWKVESGPSLQPRTQEKEELKGKTLIAFIDFVNECGNNTGQSLPEQACSEWPKPS